MNLKVLQEYSFYAFKVLISGVILILVAMTTARDLFRRRLWRRDEHVAGE